MILIIEIICLSLVLFGFNKYFDNWKKNLAAIGTYIIMLWMFLKIISRFININNFMYGQPLCTTGLTNDKLCLHYSALVVYFTGLILWCFQAFPKNYNYSIPKIDDSILYCIHSSALIGILFGFVQNWDLALQVIIDVCLLIICTFYKQLNIIEWICYNKKEQKKMV